MQSYVDLLGPLANRLQGVQASAPFACLCVRGPDAVSFVHRLCSQDVEGLAAGGAAPAAFLSAKGRLETLAWVARHDDRVWIEVQAPELEKLAALLDRYHFAERLVLEPMRGFGCRQVVGPAAWAQAPTTVVAADVDAVPLWFAGEARGLRWVRWHGDPAALPAKDQPMVSDADWELLRVAAGLPRMGLDADTGTLALEVDIDDHVSTTKGCYTGQEIVARIHTYGHTNRKLCRLRVTLPTPAPAAPPSIVDADGDDVGRITSLVPMPGSAQALALGYLPHELAASGSRLALAGGGEVVVA